MSPASRARRWLRALFAVVAPSVVIAAWLSWLLRPEPWTPTKAVLDFDRIVERGNPDVVVLGSSIAETNVEGKLLAGLLAQPPVSLITLSQGMSEPSMWYAIARYRLYANDAAPRLIVLVTTVPPLLDIRPIPDRMPKLEQHFSEPDEVLSRKVWQSGRSVWETRSAANRSRPRDALRDLVRYGLVRLVFGETAERTATETAEAAGAIVFGEIVGKGDAIAARFLPVVERDDASTQPAKTASVTPADSFIPDLAKLAADHGARLVIAIPPMAARREGRSLPAPVERDLIALVNKLHVGWIDLRGMNMDDAKFYADGGHMNKVGATMFTRALADRLTNIGALGPEPMKRAVESATITSVTRSGVGPPISPAGQLRKAKGCVRVADLADWAFLMQPEVGKLLGGSAAPFDALLNGVPLPSTRTLAEGSDPCTPSAMFAGGRARLSLPLDVPNDSVSFALSAAVPDPASTQVQTWWVYPGTSLDWEVNAQGMAGQPVGIGVRAQAVGGGLGAADLHVGELAAPFSSMPEGVGANIETTAQGSLHVSVSSAADGPFLVVKRLTLTIDDRPSDLLLTPTLKPMDALAGPLVAASTPEFSPTEAGQEGEFAWYGAPWENSLGCSPLRILRDGKALPTRPTEQFPPKMPVAGGTQHIGTRVYFTPEAGMKETDIRRHYQLTFDETRSCDWAGCATCPVRRWVYPGDHVTVSLDAAARMRATGAIRAIRLVGDALPGGADAAQLTVRATWGDLVVLATTTPVSELPGGVTLALDNFILRGDERPLQVELSLPPAAAPLRITMQATAL